MAKVKCTVTHHTRNGFSVPFAKWGGDRARERYGSARLMQERHIAKKLAAPRFAYVARIRQARWHCDTDFAVHCIFGHFLCYRLPGLCGVCTSRSTRRKKRGKSSNSSINKTHTKKLGTASHVRERISCWWGNIQVCTVKRAALLRCTVMEKFWIELPFFLSLDSPTDIVYSLQVVTVGVWVLFCCCKWRAFLNGKQTIFFAVEQLWYCKGREFFFIHSHLRLRRICLWAHCECVLLYGSCSWEGGNFTTQCLVNRVKGNNRAWSLRRQLLIKDLFNCFWVWGFIVCLFVYRKVTMLYVSC